MPPLAQDCNKHLTYKDYYSWPEDERWEIIAGVPYNMSPAPSPYHQEILAGLSRDFLNHFKKKPCKVFFAPFDVRLSKIENPGDEDITTVVQPDLLVICDEKKIDNRGCIGAPDLIIEILSPSTARKDMSEKFYLYEEHGVKEYWIVDPGSRVLHLYRLDENGKYILDKIYENNDEINSELFEGLYINLKEIFIE